MVHPPKNAAASPSTAVYVSPLASKSVRIKSRARNVLLQHQPLGNAPPSTRTLPTDITFRYGQKNILNGESAGAVLSYYETFDNTRVQSALATNNNLIMMMRRGVTGTAPFTSAANHTLRPGLLKPLPSDLSTSYTYGVRSKPDTPAGLLMSDVFQKEWLSARDRKIAVKESRELARRQLHKSNQQAAFEALVSVRERREALIKKNQGDVNVLFRLKQFENIPAKVETHRSNPVVSHSSVA